MSIIEFCSAAYGMFSELAKGLGILLTIVAVVIYFLPIIIALLKNSTVKILAIIANIACALIPFEYFWVALIIWLLAMIFVLNSQKKIRTKKIPGIDMKKR